MVEKFNNALEILKKYGQEQLLQEYDRLTEEKKEKLLDEILTIDFAKINELYEGIKSRKDIEKDVTPIDYIDKEKLTETEYKKYEEIGLNVIKENKLAVVTMAGGQGTRLGHDGPKGTYDIGLPSHKSIFEILCDTLKAAHEKYGVYVNWYLMTSDENNEQTIEFFKKKNYFGYPANKISFFKQGELPMIDSDGKILIGEDGLIKQAADGHGGIFYAMRRDGIVYDMLSKGIEWVFIGGVDNILVNMVDPVFVGVTVDKKVLAGGKSLVKAYPHEKVGVFCKKNGRPSVIEYSEISNEMAEATNDKGELQYGESHILCNLFNIKVIEDVSKDKLPYHSAFKKAEYIGKDGQLVKPTEPNAYKFEAFIFDAFESLNDMAIFRVKREEEFAPVKNAEGVDSPETAKKLYENFHKEK